MCLRYVCLVKIVSYEFLIEQAKGESTESITIIPPEEYPKGEYFMLDGDDCRLTKHSISSYVASLLGVGSLKSIINAVIQKWAQVLKLLYLFYNNTRVMALSHAQFLNLPTNPYCPHLRILSLLPLHLEEMKILKQRKGFLTHWILYQWGK